MADAKKRVLNIIPISSPTLALVAPSNNTIDLVTINCNPNFTEFF